MPAQEDAWAPGAKVWKDNLAVASAAPAALCVVLAASFGSAAVRSISELGRDGGILFAVALLLAVLFLLAARLCVAKVRRASRCLVTAARAVEYAQAEGDARATKKAVDEFGDCLTGARGAVGRIFPRQWVSALLEKLAIEMRTTDGLSEASLAVVCQVRDAALRWQDPVA
ncbi:hypothetical protein AB0393_27880 [Streptomyces cyaneofuscatus]|uniref:hypothetical protein n=1 Tax=Streptomyces cyaneofuscatus TaxID=66883 RepID=UPI00344BB699